MSKKNEFFRERVDELDVGCEVNFKESAFSIKKARNMMSTIYRTESKRASSSFGEYTAKMYFLRQYKNEDGVKMIKIGRVL